MQEVWVQQDGGQWLRLIKIQPGMMDRLRGENPALCGFPAYFADDGWVFPRPAEGYVWKAMIVDE